VLSIRVWSPRKQSWISAFPFPHARRQRRTRVAQSLRETSRQSITRTSSKHIRCQTSPARAIEAACAGHHVRLDAACLCQNDRCVKISLRRIVEMVRAAVTRRQASTQLGTREGARNGPHPRPPPTRSRYRDELQQWPRWPPRPCAALLSCIKTPTWTGPLARRPQNQQMCFLNPKCYVRQPTWLLIRRRSAQFTRSRLLQGLFRINAGLSPGCTWLASHGAVNKQSGAASEWATRCPSARASHAARSRNRRRRSRQDAIPSQNSGDRPIQPLALLATCPCIRRP